MEYARKDVEKTKKFVRYQEGAELYSIGLTKFQELRKKPKQCIRLTRLLLYICRIHEIRLECKTKFSS